MALPPEPLSELLASAAAVVEADVVAVLREEPTPSQPRVPITDSTAVAGAQQVRLAVRRVLRGSVGTEFEVLKPAGAYALAEGNTGCFLIDGQGTILGRYGCDTWPLEEVEDALAAESR